jgi:hypothetical protein
MEISLYGCHDVSNMFWMFEDAEEFDQDISRWKIEVNTLVIPDDMRKQCLIAKVYMPAVKQP